MNSRVTLLAAVAAILVSMPAQAQFSFDKLIGDAISATANHVGEAVGTAINSVNSDNTNAAAQSAPAASKGAKTSAAVSSAWPKNSQFKYYSYQGAPTPKPFYGNIVEFDLAYKEDGKNWAIEGIDFDSLPLQYAIVRVHGNGSRKIAMFTDPTCPYSRQQEQELNKLDNVTIYTFVAPLLGQKSEGLVEQILCQPTNEARAQAYDNLVLNRIKPPVVAPCKHVAQRIIASLGNRKTYEGYLLAKNSPVNILQNDILLMGKLTRSEVESHLKLKPWKQ